MTAEWFDKAAAYMRECIRTRRYRSDNPPVTAEARILFDADKPDVTGAPGVARTLLYKGAAGDPLYTRKEDGAVSDGTGDEHPSFCQEYKKKLENIYDSFYTVRGRALAGERQKAASDFYENLLREARDPFERAQGRLAVLLGRLAGF